MRTWLFLKLLDSKVGILHNHDKNVEHHVDEEANEGVQVHPRKVREMRVQVFEAIVDHITIHQREQSGTAFTDVAKVLRIRRKDQYAQYTVAWCVCAEMSYIVWMRAHIHVDPTIVLSTRQHYTALTYVNRRSAYNKLGNARQASVQCSDDHIEGRRWFKVLHQTHPRHEASETLKGTAKGLVVTVPRKGHLIYQCIWMHELEFTWLNEWISILSGEQYTRVYLFVVQIELPCPPSF